MKTLGPPHWGVATTSNFMESRPEQPMPTHLEHDLNSTHGGPTQWAPRSVGMLKHLDSTHPRSMSILSIVPFHSLAACSRGSSAPLRAQAGFDEAKTKVLRVMGFSSKSWGLAGFLV
jgi:hypothetical protein